ncbi:MAG: M48 family metallopeptidase [Candidatus Dormibacteria bacterium]
MSTNDEQNPPQGNPETTYVPPQKQSDKSHTGAAKLRSVASFCFFLAVLWIVLRWKGGAGLVWFMVVQATFVAIVWLYVYENLSTILIRSSGPAHENDTLKRVVDDLCERAHRKVVRVSAVPEIQHMQYQACAVSRPAPGGVFATDGLIEKLTEDELTAVLAHELSHIWFNAKGWSLLLGTWSILANLFLTWADAIALSGWQFTSGPFWYSLPVIILLLLVGQPFLSLPMLAIHRHMERQADEKACALGCEGTCLALALWVMLANESAARGQSQFPPTFAVPQRRSWTAEHRERLLRRLARQDMGLHAFVEYLVALFQDHPSVRDRTRYLLDEE